MKDLIKRIVQSLVDNPEQVEVSEVETDRTLILEIRMAKSDIGKVIGKQGRTAQAIRNILRAASGKVKKHIIFEILEWSRRKHQSKRHQKCSPQIPQSFEDIWDILDVVSQVEQLVLNRTDNGHLSGKSDRHIFNPDEHVFRMDQDNLGWHRKEKFLK